MKRNAFFLATLLSLCAAAPGWAQNKNGPEKDLPGKWEGTFRSDHGGGNIQMQIEHDKSWKVTLSMQSDLHPIPDQQASAFKVEGKNITWSQELMGGACTSAAVLENGELKGETKCEQVSFAFALRKK